MTKTNPTLSMLVIAPDETSVSSIDAAISVLPDVKTERTVSTLSQLNGSAVQMAARHDMVVFEAHPGDAAEIEAIRALTAAHRGKTRLVALAEDGISFAQLRALTDAGVDEVLPLPGHGTDVAQALARLGREPGHGSGHGDGNRGKLFAVLQARGGIGATTLAVNLADQLAAQQRRRKQAPKVLLADFDLQYGTIGNMLDLPEQNALLDMAMQGDAPDGQFLDQALNTLPSGLSVLPAPSRIGPVDALSPEQVQTLTAQLRARADYVVVDLPHVMVNWLEPVLRQADAILMVTDGTVPAIRHCRRQIDFLTADQPDLPIRIVMNHEQRPFFRTADLRERSRALERPLDIWLPHDARAARRAADRGLPLSRIARRSALTKAVARLAKSLAREFPVTTTISKQA